MQSLAYYNEESSEESSSGGLATLENLPENSLDMSNESSHKTFAGQSAPSESQYITAENSVSEQSVNQHEYEASQVRSHAIRTIVSQISQSQIHPTRTQVQPIPAPPAQSIEDEEMPSIDMASDSDDSDIWIWSI